MLGWNHKLRLEMCFLAFYEKTHVHEILGYWFYNDAQRF